MKSSTLLIFLLLPLFALSQTALPTAQIGKGTLLAKTRPLTELQDLPAANPAESREKAKQMYPRAIANFQDQTYLPTPFAATAMPKGKDPLLQTASPAKNLLPISPQIVFDGMDASDANAIPPDPAGDVSPDYYVQMINVSRFSVYDKAGNQLFGPFNFTLVWSEANTSAIGDPIVLWDHEAGRWLVSEMGANNALLIALSETDDPTGSWYVYEFLTPSLPDYPKYAIWPDAVVVTTNEFEADIPVYAINRQALLDGETDVPIQRLEALPKFGAIGAFEVATPADWDGSIPPPTNSPFFVLRMYDDAWLGGQDALEVWSISIDWDEPANTSIEGPTVLPTAPFNSVLCEQGFFECVQQPNGAYISALQQVLMYRVQYRNFGTHESMVLNHVVDVDPLQNQAGIRWYELRKENGGNWYIYQQGTYAPDNQSRLMGSIAMDGEGNILLGYSITGNEELPSLRFTGRRATDPPGSLTIEEFTFAQGLSTNEFNRWGDYAAMNVDPTDERTFWFNGEYMKEDGDFGTKIMTARIRRDSFDIGPASLIAPINSPDLTDAEEVSVEIRNFGYKPVANYTLGYAIDGQLPVTEMIPDTLKPDSSYIHTFAATADLSEITDYQFELFTALAQDTFLLNDTLRQAVEKLTRNDASVFAFKDIDDPLCSEQLETEIQVRNEGLDTLYSVNVHYKVNEMPPVSIAWNGTLAPGEEEAVPISSDNINDGPDNEILAYTSMPNGLVDEDMGNDTLSRSFTMNFDGQVAILVLKTDDYPLETTWQLTDFDGNVLYTGGPYTQAQTTYQEQWCLDGNCFYFTIFDVFGDGLSGFGAQGDYKIFDSNGQLLAGLQNPEFGFEEENFFCNEIDCALSVLPTITDASGPNSANGIALINVTNGFPPFQYSLDGGDSYQSNSLFYSLTPGTYELSVIDAADCQYDTLITVGYPSAVQEEENQPIVELQPNPTQNSTILTITGLQDAAPLTVQILDATGRTLRHQRLPRYGNTHQAQIATGGFPAGLYYVRIVHKDLNVLKRLIKQ